jgi:RNA polymerase sigma-70 factor (ECF subfamily)
MVEWAKARPQDCTCLATPGYSPGKLHQLDGSVNTEERSIDISLAQRVASGEGEALRIFYERYSDPLFAFIYHHMEPSTQDAQDVWQTTLLAAIQSLPSFSGKSRLFTWLCAIARHKIADYRRRSSHPVDALSDVPRKHLAELMDSAPLPEEIVMQRATRIMVVRALTNLSEDYRKALLARYIDDRPLTEISKLIGRSYKATESLLSRARAALREAVEHLEENQGEE